MNRFLSSGIFLLLLLTAVASKAQPQTSSLGSLLSSPSQDLKKRRYFTECRQFYALFNDQQVWLAGDGARRKQLARQLDAAAASGLQREKYGAAYLSDESLLQSRISRPDDSLATEIDITLAALSFVHDLAYGTVAPVAYQGVPAMNVTNRSASLLQEIVAGNTLLRMHELLAPNTDEYRILKQQLSNYLNISTAPGFRDQQVEARKGIADRKQLQLRMVQLGFEFSAGDTVQFNAAVKTMQSCYNIFPDGKVGPQTLKALNTPVAQRIRELSAGLNALRWLNAGGQGNRIVINLPAAMLVVYKDNKLVLESKIIPGKPSTPTPQLSSIATEVVLYPYWHVPYSIATKELLPIIKRDPGFLDRGAYQVLNAAGKIVDQSSVNWSGLSTKYFP
jgi:murein L,D-transpeptidase YcbB/YkuD